MASLVANGRRSTGEIRESLWFLYGDLLNVRKGYDLAWPRAQHAAGSDEEGSSYWYYLRFYPDGAVIEVSSTGKPHEIIRWFYKGNPNVSMGPFAVSGSSISFAASSSAGRVDYEGEIASDSLVLRSYSHINGHRAVEEYRHVVPRET